MSHCPHCNSPFDIRELKHEGLWASYRKCPACNGLFTQDKDTKYRQAAFIIIALLSLVFTLLLYLDGNSWLIPCLLSYLAVAGLVYWGNKKVYYVPYE